MDPLSIVASTITIVETASKIYQVLKRVKDVPKEFAEIERTLPLAKDVLQKLQDALEGHELDDESRQAIQPTLADCNAKAKKLEGILEQVRKGSSGQGGSVLEQYRLTLRRLGKANRVEKLMQSVLKGLDKLATHQVFAAASGLHVEELKKEIEKLGGLESSVPDSEFGDTNVHMEQTVAQGGSANMFNISGEGHNINAGPSPMYNSNGGVMNIGTK